MENVLSRNSYLKQVFSSQGLDGQFEAMQNLMMDTARGEYYGHTKAECEDEIRKMMFAVLDLKPEQLKDKKMFRRALKNHIDDLFEVLEDTIQSSLKLGWNNDPFFMQFVEQRNLDEGDTNEFFVDEDVVLTVSRVSGDHHDMRIQRLGGGSYFSVSTSRYAAKVGTHIKLYLTGRCDWTKLVESITHAFDVKIKNVIYQELVNIGDKLPQSAEFNKNIEISASTKPQIDKLVQDVAAINGVSNVVFVGTAAAVGKLNGLVPIEWVSENMKNEKYETGRLGKYEGHDVLEVPQQMNKVNGKFVRLIKDDQLLILPKSVMDKPIKFVSVGDPYIKEIDEQGDYQDDLMTFEYQQSFGTAVIIDRQFGVIKISA